MKYVIATATTAVACFLAGISVALAVHSNGVQRPAHLAQSVAHTSSVPTGANEAGPAMQNAYDYWNLLSLARPLNSYQNPVPFAGAKYDLIVDFVPQEGQACVYDFSHCIPITSAGYAYHRRWQDLNVGHVVWNSTYYTQVGNPIIDGQPFRIVAARHELGHDQYLEDHTTAYDGLMCNGDDCTRRSAANTAELDAASAYFQARPVAPSSISVGSTTSNSVVVNFSGAGNAESLIPHRATTYLANWVATATLSAGATSYTFTGLSSATTYHFRIAARKSGQPDSTSQWGHRQHGSIGATHQLDDQRER